MQIQAVGIEMKRQGKKERWKEPLQTMSCLQHQGRQAVQDYRRSEIIGIDTFLYVLRLRNARANLVLVALCGFGHEGAVKPGPKVAKSEGIFPAKK